ncbi:MAG: hypothetical protein KKD44_19790 [Proteobacteria bacterium]|nr:hypothetical protein [Pseudomonadota bacterium]
MGKNRGFTSKTMRTLMILPFIWAGFFLCAQSLGAKEKPSGGKIQITKDDLTWIGHTIFQQECGGKREKLLTWNRGEDFASLGIGHFIWYPVGQDGPFEESFPAFLSFLRKRGIHLPRWMDDRADTDCPWKDRKSFYMAKDSARMKSLEDFLIRTMPEQSLFIVTRLNKAFPKMMANAPRHTKIHVRNQFYRVADSSNKLYALIDYVNFKGEGTRLSERYNNEGWGLLQVLEEMKGTETGHAALKEFSRAAEAVLTRRVYNAPLHRNEARWLPGWKNRVGAYKNLLGPLTIRTTQNDNKDRPASQADT